MSSEPNAATADPALERLAGMLDDAVERLQRTRPFAKVTVRGQVLDIAGRLLAQPGGTELLYRRAAVLERAGIFVGTDWERPETLQPTLAAGTLEHADRPTVTLEALSELRLLAVANGDYFQPSLSSEQAQHFLAQVLALNLNRLFGSVSEAERERGSRQAEALHNLFNFIVEHIGYGDIFDRLVEEIERILAQRPIMVDDVKLMITRISICLHGPDAGVSAAPRGADRLISALYGPTAASREDPGLGTYLERLGSLDDSALAQEARAFARAMHDTGLVSAYHAVFLRHINEHRSDLHSEALGLSSTGRDALLCYQSLVQALIEAAITPETAQAVYGLALLLERGILYTPAVSPALWRQLTLKPSPAAQASVAATFGTAQPASTYLMAGVLNVLGQPLGVGQGNNPTCQAARALSIWAYVAPDYLLDMVTKAVRDDELVMHFEGRRISSREHTQGMARSALADIDPVSAVVVPHLDRIYVAMGQYCSGRDGDPHAWINPEMHGWWVGRSTALAVDLVRGQLTDYGAFVRRFYAFYHPFYNGNSPVTHPQPVGIAVSDSLGRFIGWHAIAIYRVALDQEGGMRVYFFNPNNDSGQDWGQGVVVSTQGRGERFGESSLPIDQFASRLYLFHYDPADEGDPAAVAAEEVAGVEAMARSTWAADR